MSDTLFLRLKFSGNAALAPDPLRRRIRFSHGEIGHRYIFNYRSISCAFTPESAFYNETEFGVETPRPIIRRTHYDLDLDDPLIAVRPRQRRCHQSRANATAAMVKIDRDQKTINVGSPSGRPWQKISEAADLSLVNRYEIKTVRALNSGNNSPVRGSADVGRARCPPAAQR